MKKTAKSARRMKDTNNQKKRKKRLAHFAGKAQPMEFCHKAINEGWDLRRTLKQNYTSMGLSTDPNTCLPIKKCDVQRKEEQRDREVPVTDSHVIRELDAIQAQAKPAPYQVRSMSIAEQKRLQALIAKHGEEYGAMARDIKINTDQETEAVLKKRIALFKRLQSL